MSYRRPGTHAPGDRCQGRSSILGGSLRLGAPADWLRREIFSEAAEIFALDGRCGGVDAALTRTRGKKTGGTAPAPDWVSCSGFS